MTFKGRPILGAISGFFLGFWTAILLMMFSVSPLTTLTFIGLPVVGLVLGLVVAWFAPFGGGGGDAASPPAAPPPAAPPEPAPPPA